MLKDITFDKNKQLVHNNREQTLSYLKKACTDKEYAFWESATIGDALQKLDTGVYEFFSCNSPDYLIEEKLDEYDIHTLRSYPYGVCDNYEQILERVKDIDKYVNSKDEDYCIVLYKVTRESQPETDGWRWCKWGDYIGDHKKTAEYFYDEKEIDYVYVFSIYKIYNEI